MAKRKKSRSSAASSRGVPPAGGRPAARGGPGGHTVYSGYHAVFEALRRTGIAGTVYLSASNRKARDIESLARDRGLAVEHVQADELARLGGTEARGAVLVGSVSSAAFAKTLEEFVTGLSAATSLVVVLDGVTDPHNVGAILRSADQFEVDLVVTRERRAAGDTATLTRTSAGAAAHVPRVSVTNIAGALDTLKEAGFWVYGAAADGTAVSSLDLSGRVGLVLGSEGEGLSRLVRERCDGLVSIPTGGHVDSLNVSVAAGILMYEVRRRDDGRRPG